MLLQVLRLTPEQIGRLPPAERDTILAFVSSLCEICDSCRPIHLGSDPNFRLGNLQLHWFQSSALYERA
ncbi:hypothetical protein BJV78DRAFT_1163693 [Lactifluus subvellereus]|nr:hypothetical protein BJV78DRAFT_1163693 [Lactifluus subvellereus]